jgi:hypothetical protein
MAILKKLKGHRVGSSTNNYWLSGSSQSTEHNYIDFLKGNNYGLIEDQNTDTLYFSDSSNDAVNMNPNFNKKILFEDLFATNLSHGFSANLLFTPNKPRVVASYNHESPDHDEEVYSSQYTNFTFKNNLDLQNSYSLSNYCEFQIGGTNFYLFVIPNRDGSDNRPQNTQNNTAPMSRVVLATGTDLSTAQYIDYTSEKHSFDLLSINPEEQVIYLTGLKGPYADESDAEYLSSNYGTQFLLALPFKTLVNDATFSFSPEKILIEDYSFYANTAFKDGYYSSIYYIGRDSADNDSFMVVYNQDVLSTNQVVLKFYKIDYTTLETATTYTNNTDVALKTLNCFQEASIVLDADPSNNNHYARQFNTTPSKFYNFDATTPSVLWAYLPLFKNTGNMALAALKWDKSQSLWADNFTLSQELLSNVSVAGAPSGDTSGCFKNPALVIPTLTSYGVSKEAHYSVFMTENNKLHILFNNIGRVLYDAINPTVTNLYDNLVSFSVNPTTPTSISYEQTSNVPCLTSCLLKNYTNSTYTELLVLSPSTYETYFYNSTTGWISSHSENVKFSEVVIDGFQRRWGIETISPSQYTELADHGYMYLRQYESKLHLISQVLPYVTSIAFQNTNVTYTNVDITNNLKVNAYDSVGSRIAIDVLVNIEGANMVFDTSIGGGTSTIVTTSTNSDTLVPVKITGPGYVNVSASYDV